MFLASFFSWWYTKGWSEVAASFKPRLLGVSNLFSVNQLRKTLFAPWRRIITYPGSNFNDRLRALSDNLFSRSVGFVVRLLVLMAAAVTALVIALLTAIELLLWPVTPFAFIIFLILGAAT